MKTIVLSYAVLLFFGITSLAQNPKGKTVKQEAAIVSSVGFAQRPFDRSVNKLPIMYVGHDAVAIVRPLFDLKMEIIRGCQKYEKTDDCQNRLNAMYDRRLTPLLSVRDLLAFSVPIDCSYSADAEKLSCPGNQSTSVWLNSQRDKGSYRAQNAFGASVNVESKSTWILSIASNRRSDGFTVDHLPPVQARKVVPSLRLLLVGDLLQPFVVTSMADQKPTFQNPTDLHFSTSDINLNLYEVWLYDSDTGQILEKKILEPIAQ